MIDTITLRLNKEDFHIIDHSKFSPDTTNLFQPPYARFGSRGYLEAYSNPTRSDYERGIYKPSLTVRKRWTDNKPEVFLYIQFSAPKLLFGNNFDELVDEDFNNVVSELKDRLLSMSVVVNENTLVNADLVKVHFSKNIVLDNFLIPYLIIQDLSKVDLSLRYDISEKDYRNGGNSLRYHSNAFELIFYDKKKDLLQSKISEKRSIEKENLIQMNLFDNLEIIKPFEVLRIEARYNSKRKLQQHYPEPKTFKDCFSTKVSATILSSIWKDVLQSYQALTVIREGKQQFIQSTLAYNPNARLNTILSAYAYLEIANSIGVRDLRKIVESHYSRKSWYTLRDRINSLEFKRNTPDYFNFITEKLQKYEPVKLISYKDAFKNEEK